MGYFHKRLLSLGGVLATAMVVEVVVAVVTPPLQRPQALWRTSLVLFAVAMPALWLYKRWYEARLKAGFSLFTAAEQLEPGHLGFEEVPVGTNVPGTRRPYFASKYIARVAVAYDERYRAHPTAVYDEVAMVDALSKGENLLLVGPVLEGKSRTLLQIVRQLRGFIVVRPRDDRVPTDEELDLLQGRNVVCLLDDLLSFVGAAVDLLHFYRSVHARAARCSIAAAYPHDPALEEAELIKTPAHRIFQALTLRLKLRAASAEDKRRLKEMLGIADESEFATLGSICMRQPTERIRAQFFKLEPAAQDCVEAMQLLVAAGVNPIFRRRLRAVLATAFQRPLDDAELRDCLERLEGHGFVVSPATADPIEPEPAYLTGSNAGYYYSSGHSCAGDWPRLEQSLLSIADAEGLNQLALAHYRNRDLASALRCWDSVLTHFSADGDVSVRQQVQRSRYDRAMTRWVMRDIDGALADYTWLIESSEVHADRKAAAYSGRAVAWEVRGDASLQRGDSDQAATDFSRAIDDYTALTNLDCARAATVARAINDRAAVWEKLGRFDRECADYGLVIEMPNAPLDEVLRACVNRSGAIVMHDNASEALLETALKDCSVVLEHSNGVSPADGVPFAYRAMVRARLGHCVEARADADAAEKLAASAELLPIMRAELAQRCK